MKTRLLFLAVTLLGFSISLVAQLGPKPYPIKFGPLKAGDALMVAVFKPQEPFTGVQINFSVRVVVRDDGKLNVPFPVAILKDVTAGGLTIVELQQLIQARYAEYFGTAPGGFTTTTPPHITIQFIGNGVKTPLNRIADRLLEEPRKR